MAEKKRKRIKKESYQTEEQLEIKKFLIILLVVVILVGIVYLFTRIFVTKDLFNKNEEKTIIPGEINYDKTTIGLSIRYRRIESSTLSNSFSVPSEIEYALNESKHSSSVIAYSLIIDLSSSTLVF